MKSYRIVLVVLLGCILLVGVLNYLSLLKVQNDTLIANIDQIRRQIRFLEASMAQTTIVKDENVRLKGQVESLKTQLAMLSKQPAKAQAASVPVSRETRATLPAKTPAKTPDNVSGNKGFLLKK